MAFPVVKDTLLELKRSLEKLVKDESAEEKILDELKVLENLSITPDLIKETKIAKIVSNVRDKYDVESSDIGQKAKNILISWKKLVESHRIKPKQDEAKKIDMQHKKEIMSNIGVAKFDVNTVPINSISTKFAADVAALVPVRTAIYKVFHNVFKDYTSDEEKSIEIALKIESALNNKHPFNTSGKIYNSKAKSLAFNLKKNDVIKQRLIAGQIDWNDLIVLPTTELASREVQEKREQVNTEVTEGRRLDWLEENKDKILVDNGLDPKNNWEYDDDDDDHSGPDMDPPDI